MSDEDSNVIYLPSATTAIPAPPRSAYELVEILNSVPRPVLDCDLPDGVPADWLGTWRIEGGVVCCDLITFADEARHVRGSYYMERCRDAAEADAALKDKLESYILALRTYTIEVISVCNG